MKKTISVISVICLTGCGSFNLGLVHPQAGKTAEQQQLDMLTCKDRAAVEANTEGRQIGSFLAGLTVIGAPIAYEAEKAKQREVFTDCMQARGYTVTPADVREGANRSLPTFSADNIKLTLPAGFEEQPVIDTWRKNGIFFYALNRTTDIGTFVSAAPRAAITDMSVYVATLKARQESSLQDGQSSQITQTTVNGRPAMRFEVTGISNGIKLTYMTTVIEGAQQICVVNSWTSATNFPNHRDSMNTIPQNVTGIV